jgi:hypothetical protein
MIPNMFDFPWMNRHLQAAQKGRCFGHLSEANGRIQHMNGLFLALLDR